jgi:hypothetical protein
MKVTYSKNWLENKIIDSCVERNMPIRIVVVDEEDNVFASYECDPMDYLEIRPKIESIIYRIKDKLEDIDHAFPVNIKVYLGERLLVQLGPATCSICD